MLEGFTPWPKELAKKYVESGYWPNETLGDLLDQTIEAGPQRIAISSDRASVSYSELGSISNRLALKLLELGIKKDDRVVVQLPNWPEVLYFLYALARFGGISLMALRHFRQREMEHLLNLSEAKAWVIPDVYHDFNYLAMAQELLPRVPSLKHVIVAGKEVTEQTFDKLSANGKSFGHKPFEKLDAVSFISLDKLLTSDSSRMKAIRFQRPDPDDILLLLLTGGTTALPKLIPHTHNDFICSKRAVGPHRGFNRDTVSLIVVPVGHNAPMGAVILCAIHGGRVVLQDSTRIADIASTIEREKVTEVFQVPTQIIDLLNFPDVKKYNLSSLKVIYTGGSRCPPEVVRGAMEKLGCQIVNAFGSGEGLHITTRLGDPVEVIADTVGRPCCTIDEIKIVNDRGKEVPIGVEGELIARGPHILRGYFKNPEENKKAFDKDGFFYTGDLGMWRKDGNIAITGRKKDMLLRGGENISAVEVEELLLSHADILQAAVVGMPDPRMGERVCAYIIPREGKKPAMEEVVAFLKTKGVALFKLPERLEIVKEFPLTNIGKVSKKDLRNDITRKLKAEGKI